MNESVNGQQTVEHSTLTGDKQEPCRHNIELIRSLP